jgi:hypothetical protein
MATLDPNSSEYMDSLIDLLIRDYKLKILRDYMSDPDYDQNTHEFLTRAIMLNKQLNMGLDAEQAIELGGASSRVGKYHDVVKKLMDPNWMNYENLVNGYIGLDGLVIDWCTKRNTKLFGDNAADFATRDRAGMISYCILTQTNFAKKYLMTLDDSASNFVAAYKTAQIHDEMQLCNTVADYFQRFPKEQDAKRNFIHSGSLRMFGKGASRAWPAQIAFSITGQDKGHPQYEQMKEKIKGLFSSMEFKLSLKSKNTLEGHIVLMNLNRYVELVQSKANHL